MPHMSSSLSFILFFFNIINVEQCSGAMSIGEVERVTGRRDVVTRADNVDLREVGQGRRRLEEAGIRTMTSATGEAAPCGRRSGEADQGR